MSGFNILHFTFGKCFVTLNTLLVAGRNKEIVYIKKHEMYLESGMHIISMHGNCGGEELKNFFCLMFLYDLIISNTYATNNCVD